LNLISMETLNLGDPTNSSDKYGGVRTLSNALANYKKYNKCSTN